MTHYTHLGGRHAQRGLSLVVTLIMLLVITIVGVAAMTNNHLQVRMAHSATESNLSFQSAETALAHAEGLLEALTERPTVAASCASPCAVSNFVWDPTAVGSLTSFNFAANGRAYNLDYAASGTTTPSAIRTLPGLSSTPYYIIEEIGQDPGFGLGVGLKPSAAPIYYRVTAAGNGALNYSRTLVQSVYVKQY